MINNNSNTTKVTKSGQAANNSVARYSYKKLARDYMCFILVIFCASHFLSELGLDNGIQQVQAADEIKCPAFSCNNDQVMNESAICYKATPQEPVEKISVQKCENASEKCYIPDNKYVWVSSERQFDDTRESQSDPALSQIYGKVFKQECVATESLQKDLNNGRKCIYAYQCKSRVCQEGTGACLGREEGESCSTHEQCHKQLACRPNNIWPFDTACLPLSEVGSQCETDFDCKPRNFCWKLKTGHNSICLEKHSAPDYTEFVWDINKFPKMTKESVMFHGQYCNSGIAAQKLKDTGNVDPDNKPIMEIDPTSEVAVCITIDKEFGLTSDPNEMAGTELTSPYQCKADGKDMCLYKKLGQTYFKLLCECGLQEDAGVGYCPLPGPEMLQKKNEYLYKMWIGDNCHTLDRHKFRAQLECGIGNNFGTLANATNYTFDVNYYPYIQGDNFECITNFIPDSNANIFSGSIFGISVSRLSIVFALVVFALY